MKFALVFTVFLLMLCGHLSADDYIRIDVDTLYENESSEWKFYLKRECPEPEIIMSAKNAFQMDAVGNATWDFVMTGFAPFPEHMEMWNLGGLMFHDRISGSGKTTGLFEVSGVATSPGGMPVMDSEVFWFSLYITMGDLPPGSTGDGILIDSTAFIGTS